MKILIAPLNWGLGHATRCIPLIRQYVAAGDEVLKIGTTGYSTGPHAHFEIRINGETINPLDYISIKSTN